MSFLFCSSCSGGASFLSLLSRADGGGTYIIRYFARLKSEVVIFDILYRRKEPEKEDGPGEKVEDTVEDHFARHRDDVPTLSKTPANGIKYPDERNVACGKTVHRLVRKEA